MLVVPRRSVTRAFAVLAVLCGVAPPTVSAQDRLFIGTGEIGAFGRFGERIGDAPDPVHGRFVAGGRYVVTGESYEPVPTVYDTRTGQVVPIPQGRVVDVDPIRPRIFLRTATDVSMWDLERLVLTPLVAIAESEGFLAITDATYAAESDELFVWTRGAAIPPMSVVNVATGVVRLLTLDATFPSRWAVTPDGSRLLVPHALGGQLVLYDGRTGARLAAQSVGDVSTPFYDARFDRWYHTSRGGLTAFDAQLGVIATLPLQGSCGSNLALSPHTDRLYVVDAFGRSGSGQNPPMRLRLTVFNTTTGAVVGSGDVTAAGGVPPDTLRCAPRRVTVLTAPGAPRNLAATIAGRDVTLAWTNPGDATNFVVDVGVVPGRADASFGVGAASPVTLADAPPGTYYVRVRGTNAFGVSRPSNEVMVSVQ